MTDTRIRRQVDKVLVAGALITNAGPAGSDHGATMICRPLWSRLVAASHCHRDDAADVLRCLYEVPVGEVRVARRGAVPPVPEEPANQGQALA